MEWKLTWKKKSDEDLKGTSPVQEVENKKQL